MGLPAYDEWEDYGPKYSKPDCRTMSVRFARNIDSKPYVISLSVNLDR